MVVGEWAGEGEQWGEGGGGRSGREGLFADCLMPQQLADCIPGCMLSH